MSYTPEQLTQYNKLKGEVLFCQKQMKSTGWLYALGLGTVLALLFPLLSLLGAHIDGEDISRWAREYNWVQVPFNALLAALLFYFVRVQKHYHRLINKKRELHNLLLEHPDLEKPFL